jgi:hypothetical protein
MTLAEARSFVLFSHGLSLEKRSVLHVLVACPGIKRCGVFREEGRVEVREHEIVELFETLGSMVDGVPAAFVFNMDEMGHRYREDQKEMCYVPVTAEEDLFCLPFFCGWGDGSCSRPVLVRTVPI